MKIFITGINGQLGSSIAQIGLQNNYEIFGCSKKENNYLQLDITDQKLTISTIQNIHPDVIIHCAAWTNVDAAEDNIEQVNLINYKGTENIVKAAKLINAKLVYISTDYVFNGEGSIPWKPDDKNYNPLNIYGKSKLDGELIVSSLLENYFIIRIAWVFGQNGNNFVDTMLKIAKTHNQVRVVNDQIGTPTYTDDLSKLILDMIKTDKYGYYHITNEGGYISWYDFCCEIYKQANISTQVIPVTTEEYGLSKAKRPKNSRLDKSKLLEQGFYLLPDWRDALRRYLCQQQII